MNVPDTERAIVAQRLVLEPLQVRHAALVYEAMRDERLYRYHAGRPSSLEALELRFMQLVTRRSPERDELWLNWAVRLQPDGSYVGLLQATVSGSYAIIGYDIFADHWRKGYGRESCTAMIEVLFSEFGVKRIAAIVDAENVASVKLLETLEFERVWTGPSEDMPGRQDYRYERSAR